MDEHINMDELKASINGQTTNHYNMDDVSKERHVHTIAFKHTKKKKKKSDGNKHSFTSSEKG